MKLLLGIIAVVAIGYLWQADFETYAITTVGVFNRLTRYKSHSQQQQCSHLDCDSGCKEGEIRKGHKEAVLFGCPIKLTETVTNAYCPDHTSFEFQQGQYRETTTRRVAATVTNAIVTIDGFKPATEEPEAPFDDVSKNVASGVNDAFALIPVAVMIVIIASFAGIARTLRGEL